jgi:hypothetical protein
MTGLICSPPPFDRLDDRLAGTSKTRLPARALPFHELKNGSTNDSKTTANSLYQRSIPRAMADFRHFYG